MNKRAQKLDLIIHQSYAHVWLYSKCHKDHNGRQVGSEP
jgi:hypothetical protein